MKNEKLNFGKGLEAQAAGPTKFLKPKNQLPITANTITAQCESFSNLLILDKLLTDKNKIPDLNVKTRHLTNQL